MELMMVDIVLNKSKNSSAWNALEQCMGAAAKPKLGSGRSQAVLKQVSWKLVIR
jgi:hypothetical protein